MSGLGNSAGQINDEWSRLQKAWEQVASQWNDPVQYTFAHKFMESYGPKLGQVTRALETAARTIAAAQQQVK